MTGRHLPCRSSTLGDLRLAVALWLTEGRNLRLDLVFRLAERCDLRLNLPFGSGGDGCA